LGSSGAVTHLHIIALNDEITISWAPRVVVLSVDIANALKPDTKWKPTEQGEHSR
jgi:hypothetical protein